MIFEEDRIESIEISLEVEDDEVRDMFSSIYNRNKVYSKKELKVIDNDLGLEIVEKPTIWEKYRVQCDPNKNSFHKSLYDQFERKGYLSPKQVEALR